MAKTTPTRASTNEAIEALRFAVQNMDEIADRGCDEIAAVANLALQSLQRQALPPSVEPVVHALHVIWGRADDMQNCINSHALDVGVAA